MCIRDSERTDPVQIDLTRFEQERRDFVVVRRRPARPSDRASGRSRQWCEAGRRALIGVSRQQRGIEIEAADTEQRTGFGATLRQSLLWRARIDSRQALGQHGDRVRIDEIALGEQQAIGEADLTLDDAVSVSYTHLDVYKRQE